MTIQKVLFSILLFSAAAAQADAIQDQIAQGRPVVAFFSRPACPYCPAVANVFNQVRGSFPSVSFVHINVMGGSPGYGVMSVPTVIVFNRTGGIVARFGVGLTYSALAGAAASVA